VTASRTTVRIAPELCLESGSPVDTSSSAQTTSRQTLQGLPWVMGLLACLSVMAFLDLADDVSWSAPGPGLTFDEGLNIEGGVYYVETALRSGLGIIHPGTWYDIFNHPDYHPDYPPLGRLPAALTNAVLFRLLGADGHSLYVVTYARVGTAIVFGFLICLITSYTRRRFGTIAAVSAGLSFWLTPRVFGHAHLASVETMMNLSYSGFLLLTLWKLAPREQLTWKDGLLPGILLGLALLTKIQAIFLPPVFTVWILWNWRLRGVPALAVTAITSLLVFLIGWPWLWGDPPARLIQYFSQATERVTLYCYYFGERFADKQVPWHYPFVMFLFTTPVLFLILGSWGMVTPARSGGFQRREAGLILGSFFFPLIVFALPGVAVYDGERLFLIVWPVFSLWVGLAVQRLILWVKGKTGMAPAMVLLCLLLSSPLWNLFSVHPCLLSSYSLLPGSLFGANRLGMEATYWGDSLTPDFLKEMSSHLPEGTTVGVAPVLHPLFLEGLRKDSWLRHRPDLKLVPYDDQRPDSPKWVFLIRRQADPWESLLNPPPGTERIGAMERQSVPLAELLKLPN